jgi:hypothetical protein
MGLRRDRWLLSLLLGLGLALLFLPIILLEGDLSGVNRGELPRAAVVLGVGVMIGFAVNIGEVGLVSLAFPWAIASLLGMAFAAVILGWILWRRQVHARMAETGRGQGVRVPYRPSP